MDKLTGRVRAAVQKYDLIDEGDKIAVGVSGGKDSLFLLCALAELLPLLSQALHRDSCHRRPLFRRGAGGLLPGPAPVR